MNKDMLERLNAIDVAILTDVVRQDQYSPSFVITDWSIRRLSDKGIANPDGLWLFSGQGHDSHEARQWSIVVKIFIRPELETPPDDLYYWKREFLLAQSGLLERLPGPVLDTQPRCLRQRWRQPFLRTPRVPGRRPGQRR